jgi:hypothetical protein
VGLEEMDHLLEEEEAGDPWVVVEQTIPPV